MSALEHLVVVGPGRVGLALAYALAQAEAVSRLTICGRRPEPPAHPLFTQGLAEYVFGRTRPGPRTAAVLLAVPDSVVPEIAHALAGHGAAPGGCAALHLSGALSTEVLAPLHAQGYEVGSFHPLQAIAHPVTGAERLPGSWVAVAGTPVAVAVARRLAASLGAPLLSIPEARRSLYHAAAVLVSNSLPPLVGAARRLLQDAGVPHDDALAALLPLVRGTVENMADHGVEAAMTGPVARGDLETVDLNLRALDGDDRRLYAVLGLELLRLGTGGPEEETRRGIMARLNSEIVG
ncbi:MAG: DUF2520 domain-containing protein [Gemmatimonadetes bacterium]|nr:DUF2520 domain-containing protein [Gemmatimonadota bacterium]